MTTPDRPAVRSQPVHAAMDQFEVRDGQLWCTVPGEPAFAETRFALDGPDGFRAVHGRECGERLELHRDESGRVTRMSFATYAVTREPASFGDLIGS